MAQTYNISKVKQLIDLNGDSENFEATFHVKSDDGKPFDLLIVDQATLDQKPTLDYKHVSDGEISGTVRHDKNGKQNYYIILKSDTPCKCTVNITKKDLPKQQEKSPPHMLQGHLNQQPEKNDGFNWIKISLVVAGIIAIGIVVYWFYKAKKGDTAQPKIQSNDVFERVVPSPVHSSNYSPVHASPSSYHGSPHNSQYSSHISKTPDNPLLGRLKSLQLN